MFGMNPIRSISHEPNSLAVESIFYTIQGEGPYAGSPALFIRLAGCNLACHFCDTQFETMAEKPQPIADIVKNIEARSTRRQRRLVVMTGGEPLRQNWAHLAEWLLANGTETIQVETAGTLWQQELDRLTSRIHLVCSPKTPNVNRRVQDLCRDWKYIVRAGEVDPIDGLPNRGTQNATKDLVQFLYRPLQGRVWLSPCDDYDPDKNKANQDLARDLCMRHGYRLSLQMHKLIGVE